MDNTSPDVRWIMGHWGLATHSWEKVKDVYKVATDHGIKNLRASPNDPFRLSFVHQAIRYLGIRGFKGICQPIPTPYGNYYVYVKQHAYSLFDWIEGRQCDFGNRDELINCTKTLAEFHQRSEGFIPSEKLDTCDNLGKCLDQFEERYQDLLKFRDVAISRPKTPFSELYLENVADFLQMAKISIAKLSNSSYYDLVRRAALKRNLCHGDPAARNFIITPDGSIFIIDLDAC